MSKSSHQRRQAQSTSSKAIGTITYSSSVLPGQCVNLLAGLRPNADNPFTRSVRGGFADSARQAARAVLHEDAFFGPLELVACPSWSALVTALFDRYTVRDCPPSLAAAAVLQPHTRDGDANRQALAQLLGVHESDAVDGAGVGFVLARMPRTLGGAGASLSDSGCKEFRSRLLSDFGSELRKLEGQLCESAPGYVTATPENVRMTLSFYSESGLGSHVVESIRIGDEAYQVFVFEADQYETICQAMDKQWSGPQAMGFRYFTQPNFLKYAGPVQLLSGDPAFSDIIPFLDDSDFMGISSESSQSSKPSIFMLVLRDEARDRAAALTHVTCVAAQLDPMTTLLTAGDRSLLRALAPHAVDRSLTVANLLDGVAIQGFVCRFGDGAGAAAFAGKAEDYAQIYSQLSPPANVSMLWSPFMSLTQMYVRLDNLWKQPALNKNGVKHLLVTADVVEVSGDADISGLETLTLACRRFVATGTPRVILSASAWDPLRLYCGSMSGTCVFQKAGAPADRRVVFGEDAVSVLPDKDAVVYDKFFAGTFPIQPFYESGEQGRAGLDAEWRKTTLQNGLDTLLLTSMVPLKAVPCLSANVRRTAQEAWNCLQWIETSSKQAIDAAMAAGKTAAAELRQVYGQAVLLRRSVQNPYDAVVELPAQVPVLRYTAFQDSVDRLLALAKDYARQIDQVAAAIRERNEELERQYREDERDKDIRAIGRFLLDQNEALGKRENDLLASHNEIISKKRDMRGKLTGQEATTSKQIEEQTKKLSDAKDKLNSAIKTKVAEERAKLWVDTILGITQAAVGIWFGVSSLRNLPEGISNAEKTLKKLEAFLKIVESCARLSESLQKISDFKDMTDLSKVSPSGAPPTDTDWELFVNDYEAAVKLAEDFVPNEAASYVAAVRDLAAVGKSLVAIQAQKAQLDIDIFEEESARLVSANHANRLRQLQLNLADPKLTPDTDYIADLGRFNAVLQERQTRALLTMMDLLTLQDASMTYHYLSGPMEISSFDLTSVEEAMAIQAVNAVRALQTYPYPPTDLQQPVEYVVENVPVNELTSKLGHEFQVDMGQGDFNTLARVRINSVDVRVNGVTTSTGKCHVKLTSLGNPMLDRGLDRATLRFGTIPRAWDVVYNLTTGETIIGTEPAKEWGNLFTKPTPFQRWRVCLPATSENLGLQLSGVAQTVTLRFRLEAVYSPTPVAVRRLLLEAGAPPDFISRLENKSITQGWDAITFLSVDKINHLWQQRWEQETQQGFKGDRTFLQEIHISRKVHHQPHYDLQADLDMKIGPPLLIFKASQTQQAEIRLPVIKGVLTTTWYKDGQQDKTETIEISSTAEKPALITSQLPLLKLHGLETVGDAHTVYIDPRKGIFKLEGVKVDLAQCQISELIAEYLIQQKLQPWKLGAVRLPADKEFLSPTQFFFRTHVPPQDKSGDWPSVLGLFILTTTEKPPLIGTNINLGDVWPVDKEHDAAVYFSSSLVWKNVVQPAVRAKIPGATFDSPDTAKLSGLLRVFEQDVNLREGWYENSRKVTRQAKVDFPLKDLKLELDMTSLRLSCSSNWDENFPYQAQSYSRAAMDVFLDTGWEPVSFHAAIDAKSLPKLDPDKFTVTFPLLTVSPQVSAKSQGFKFLWITVDQLDQRVVKGAKQKLSSLLGTWDIDLGALPFFAMANILFPESKAIVPQGVYFPEDMVLVGSVSKDWAPVTLPASGKA